MDANLYSFAFDWSNHVDPYYSFAIRYQTESVSDFLIVHESSNGSIWATRETFTNNSFGWVTRNYERTVTQPQTFYVWFWFHSDASNANYGGVFIDDFAVTATATTLPNLSYIFAPPFWSGGVVAATQSSDKTEPFEHLTNIPYFINWPVENTGDHSSPITTVQLYIDDTLKHTANLPSILANSGYEVFSGYAKTFTTEGWHELNIRINPNETFEEETYDDNDYFRNIYVRQPKPNLAPTIRSGWSGSLVINHNPTGTADQTMYIGQTAYAHWAIKNIGEITASNFSVRVRLDGATISTTPITTLASNAQYYIQGINLGSLSAGNHTINLDIDYTLAVNESDELDNNVPRTVNWQLPTFSVDAQDIACIVRGLGLVEDVFLEGFQVEVWDVNVSNSTLRSRLWYGKTQAFGTFTTSAIDNVDNDGTRIDVQVRLLATIPDTVVVERDTVYAVKDTAVHFSTVFENVNNGTLYLGAFDMAVDTPNSARFYIADQTRKGVKAWRQLRAENPGSISIAASNLFLDGSLTNPFSNNQIEISLSTLPGLYDGFDRWIIQHELNHVFQNYVGFFDEGSDSHTDSGKYDPKLSISEGFCDFWASYVLNDTISEEFSFRENNWLKGSWLNHENGKYGFCSSAVSPAGNVIQYGLPQRTSNTRGDSNEAAISGYFFDMLDNFPILEDFSGPQDRDSLRMPHTPDGIGDSMSVGVSSILAALIDRQVPQMTFRDSLGNLTTVPAHKPDRFSDFAYTWFRSPSSGHFKGMSDLRLEHGMSCCFGIRGNINNDTLDVINVLDLNYLTQYMYSGGPAPVCMDEANINGFGTLNIADANFLVYYLFVSSTPTPARCPEY